MIRTLIFSFILAISMFFAGSALTSQTADARWVWNGSRYVWYFEGPAVRAYRYSRPYYRPYYRPYRYQRYNYNYGYRRGGVNVGRIQVRW